MNEPDKTSNEMPMPAIRTCRLRCRTSRSRSCSSRQSRNFRVGYGLGKGRDLEEIIDEMQMVAEGVKSTAGILALSQRYEADMPIAEKVGEVLYDGLDVTEALHQLMTREVGEEFRA